LAFVSLSCLTATEAATQQAGERMREALAGTDLGFETIYVPGGEFILGSPTPGSDEAPMREVRVSGFWMAVHEVPHELFAAFRDPAMHDAASDHARDTGGSGAAVDAVTHPSTPYDDPAHGLGGEGKPAVGMTRWAALQFARWLSLRTGRLYRLPTEVEWEYACRTGLVEGGGERRGPLTEVAWHAGNSDGRLHPVGSRAPDARGIHDLLGNAAEWTLDPYVADFYATMPDDEVAENPRSGPPGTGRGVVRGGSFRDPPDTARCTDRQPEDAAWKRRDPQVPKSRWWNTDAPHVGFRLVRPLGTYSPEQIRAYWREVLGDDPF
jgi:formylglycine-generating enzyme required for sulfatase activity